MTAPDYTQEPSGLIESSKLGNAKTGKFTHHEAITTALVLPRTGHLTVLGDADALFIVVFDDAATGSVARMLEVGVTPCTV